MVDVVASLLANDEVHTWQCNIFLSILHKFCGPGDGSLNPGMFLQFAAESILLPLVLCSYQ